MRTWKPVVGTGNIGSPDPSWELEMHCRALQWCGPILELDHWPLFGYMKWEKSRFPTILVSGQSGCRVMRFGPSVGAWELEGLLWFVTTSCCTFRLSSLVIHCQDPMVTVCRWSVKYFLPESRSRPIQLVALSGVHRSEDGGGLTASASRGRNQRSETFSAGSE